VSTSESGRVINAIRKVDESAFINTLNTERVKGRFYQRPID